MINDNRQYEAELWETYQSSFRQFAKQASAVNFAQEPDTMSMLALEEARAAYSRARDAVALSLVHKWDAKEEPAEKAQCACV